MAVRTRYRVEVAMTSAHAGNEVVSRAGAPRVTSKARALLCALSPALLSMLLTACAGKPPPPDWQPNAKAATDQFVAAYLSGNTRVESAALERARSETARTGRADLVARVELTRCAAQVASLEFGPCAGFEPLRADAGAPERAYADYLLARVSPSDIALLPEPQRAVAAGGANSAANVAALTGIADPLSKLVAAGVLFQESRADPQVIALAIDTASLQGWRRPLLAWLGVELKRAEQAGASDDAQRLRRRIALAQGI
jgi:hypothetical protein